MVEGYIHKNESVKTFPILGPIVDYFNPEEYYFFNLSSFSNLKDNLIMTPSWKKGEAQKFIDSCIVTFFNVDLRENKKGSFDVWEKLEDSLSIEKLQAPYCDTVKPEYLNLGRQNKLRLRYNPNSDKLWLYDTDTFKNPKGRLFSPINMVNDDIYRPV